MALKMNTASLSVCMFSNLYPPVVSGSSTQAASLSRELARRGCQIVVITAKTSKDSKEYEEIDNVHIYRLPAIRLPKMSIALSFPWLSYTFTPKNLRRIKTILKQHKPDVLHLHNHMFDLALSAVLMRRWKKKPLVITIHTVIKHTRNFYNLLLYPADRLLLKHVIINQADALICPDLNNKDYVLDAFGKSEAALVPYGISLSQKPVDTSVKLLRTKYNLNGKRVILSLGHVHALRNRKDLIEALPDVLKVFPNTVLLIVGTVGDDSPVALAQKLRVHDSVILTGHMPHSEVPAFLSLADLEAHWLNQHVPQKTSLGIASLEAMWAGKVVITAAREDALGQDVLQNGENIILVEPGNPGKLAKTIVELLRDSKRCKLIGEQARQTVQEHFSWDSVCTRTLDVYKEVLRKHKTQ
jgi:glycosyltransferase involved in cell wall biosynthesis